MRGRANFEDIPHLFRPLGEFYPNKVKNINGSPFRISLFPSPPYIVNFSRSDSMDDQEWFGYDGGLTGPIIKMFNAKLQIIVPKNNNPG